MTKKTVIKCYQTVMRSRYNQNLFGKVTSLPYLYQDIPNNGGMLSFQFQGSLFDNKFQLQPFCLLSTGK